jgi:hypothetical protein
VNYSATAVGWATGCEGVADDSSAAPFAVANTTLSGRHLTRTFLAAGWDSSSVEVTLDRPRQWALSGDGTYKSGRHPLSCSSTSLVLGVGT